MTTIILKQHIIAGMILLAAAGGVCSQEKKPSPAETESSGVNLAKGKTCVFDPAPNYELCTDPADNSQLTDGEIYKGPELLWVRKSTVGWRGVSHALITVDLGQIEPISGASLHTAFDGPSNVLWPRSIRVFVSDDNREFSLAGNLVDPAWPDCLPPELAPFGNKQRQVFHHYAAKLNTRGRYVCFALQCPMYAFCDEIEVLRGPGAPLEKTVSGQKINSLKDFLTDSLLKDNVTGVLLRDINRVRQEAQGLSSKDQVELAGKLDQLEKKTMAMELQYLTDKSRAISPLNDIHRDIMRIHAAILKARQYPSLAAWHNNRWDPLDALDIPSKEACDETPTLNMEMMTGEYRAETVNLTNASENDLEAEISFAGLPGGSLPKYISVHQVEFVGTQEGSMIADPLPLTKRDEKSHQISIPSGMTRQIWISFNPQDVKSGRYQGTLLVKTKQQSPLKIPLSFTLHPFRFPAQPFLSLAMFDYTDKPYAFKSATDQNVPLAIKDMKEHFVDTPYGHCACWPQKEDFDADGSLSAPLRTSDFDDWIGRWNGARRYHIYLGNALEKFCGEPMGTPRFNRMVGQWAAAFARHVQSKGIAPKQIAIHLFDEPLKDEQYTMNTIWGKAIKSGAPEIQLFTDTSSFLKPTPALMEMIHVHDIICPHLPEPNVIDKAQAVLKSELNSSKCLWFYSSFGPSHLFDPYYYHRLQAWHCWRAGAVGMAFWDYWNYYKEKNCTAWNEFVTTQETFGVSYTTENSVISSKHWEAVREGIEDYEYLLMLSTRIEELKKKGIPPESLREAEQLIESLPSKVAGKYDKKMVRWTTPRNRSEADQARMSILKALKNLPKPEKNALP
ncbi:MAG: hypothetical protein PHV34_24455 [Verrucomicrobiae bacterium]|nr:hypothetical protein [Verrucomicrobiae bacterium]